MWLAFNVWWSCILSSFSRVFQTLQKRYLNDCGQYRNLELDWLMPALNIMVLCNMGKVSSLWTLHCTSFPTFFKVNWNPLFVPLAVGKDKVVKLFFLLHHICCILVLCAVKPRRLKVLAFEAVILWLFCCCLFSLFACLFCSIGSSMT